MKKVFKGILKWLGIVLLAAVLIFCAYTLIGRAVNAHKTDIDTAQGIEEDVTIEINGISQELHICGEDTENPVVLFLHGGPGSPTSYFDYYWQPCLNDDFTFVTFDQRGCGRTYYANPGAEVSRELILQDIDSIVDYLTGRFAQQKVIIMGHSWGTLLGTLYVSEHPEKVSSYIGVGQVVNTFSGEEIGVTEAIKRAEAAGDSAYVEEMTASYEAFCKSMAVDSDFINFRSMEPKYLSGEREKGMASLIPIVLTSPSVRFMDMKWYLFDSGKILSAADNPLTAELFSFDANDIQEYQVPMYFISGGSDYVTPFASVEVYCKSIKAPKKDFVLIPGAGHNTFVDAPEDFAKAVRSLELKG